jgi:UDP-3-O-[3-hydroxymyristoyl] glucosamine N-acyltransferase
MEYTVGRLSHLLSLKIIGESNSSNLIITGISSIKEAKNDEISFVANSKYVKYLKETDAAAVIMDYSALKNDLLSNSKFIILDTKDPYLAFAKATHLFSKEIHNRKGFISDKTYIDKSAIIDDNATIYPGVFIGEGVKIGKNCLIMANVSVGKNVIIGDNAIIYPNAVIYDDSIIGDRCIIHAGSVIGSDGFGYARDGKKYVKIIHSGRAILENDVEIGALTAVDRGAVGPTIIKRGTKIDNLVQIAHNVIIGENCAIAAQTGIAGSALIGDNVVIGGQVGIAGHLSIGDNVMIAGQSGVSHDIKNGEIIAGSPAFSIKDWQISAILFKKLPELFKKIKKFEKTEGD